MCRIRDCSRLGESRLINTLHIPAVLFHVTAFELHIHLYLQFILIHFSSVLLTAPFQKCYYVTVSLM